MQRKSCKMEGKSAHIEKKALFQLLRQGFFVNCTFKIKSESNV